MSLSWDEDVSSLVGALADQYDAALVLELPSARFFFRRFEAPSSARGAMARLAVAEIERRTPFRLDEIHHGFAIHPASAAGKIVVRQTIVRRDFVVSECDRLGIAPGALEGLVIAGDPSPHLAVRMRIRSDDALLKLGRACVYMVILGAFLAGIALVATWTSQARHLDELQAEMDGTRAKAMTIRQIADRIVERQAAERRISTRKAERPKVVDLLEEVSRVLPDDTWLSEFRLSATDGEEPSLVTLTGYSAASAELVGVIDRSNLLFDARLTAPIVFDAGQDRERFSLDARLRHPPSRTAAPPAAAATQ